MKVGRFNFSAFQICAATHHCQNGYDVATHLMEEYGCTRRQALILVFKAQDKGLLVRAVNMSQQRLTPKGERVLKGFV